MVGGDSILCRRGEDICPEDAIVEGFLAFVDLTTVQVIL
jgi:formate hydrogenlyase subunit 6/NADH:ubiquinone oxidoreductase subunit I